MCCELYNIVINQSPRYGRHQAACREPAGSYDKTARTAICFEHKTQYLLIRAPYTRIVVFWHISNIPPMISQSQISCSTPTLCIAAIKWDIVMQPAVGCYNSRANLRCSGCYPLGEKLLWNRSIGPMLVAPVWFQFSTCTLQPYTGVIKSYSGEDIAFYVR